METSYDESRWATLFHRLKRNLTARRRISGRRASRSETSYIRRRLGEKNPGTVGDCFSISTIPKK
ncbi:hypothetical protein Csa_006712 [Cucumis sativus]|uniref:Uncharacterized protein n=1 Tax=Cucumis sativus TaxID=3659 RepID=A0A0A0LL09_CUCSA|nr:hypothetical protein Csa_006712 [Cucumis sativus]